MRKYINIFLAVAVFLSLAQVSLGGALKETEKITVSTSSSADFYGHVTTRPPEVADGVSPGIYGREVFDRVFRGNDRFVGLISNTDVAVYVDGKTGCYYKGNDKNILYHIDLLSGGTDAFYGFTPTIQWTDGNMTKDVPFSYDPAISFGNCSDIKTRTKAFTRKLIHTGSVAVDLAHVVRVYEPRSPLNSSELKKLYRGAVFPEGETPSFETYVTMHPLVYMYDNFGSFHRLLNSQFAPAAEMGKPALYLYPEKDTKFTVKVLPVGGKITEQIPVMDNLTWHALAKPSGELNVGNVTYPYLYYESTTNQPMPMTKGAVVAQKDVPAELAKMLDTLGFKTNEKTEFLAYWLPRMNSQPYYAIQFLINEEVDAYSTLSIQPKLPIYRVFMNFQGSSKPVKLPTQELPTLDRSAPHAFEWGGNNLAK